MSMELASTPPSYPLARLALFLDLDGTVAPISSTPDAAYVPASSLILLERLQVATGGALAIVSGRDGTAIDRMLDGLRLPYAATHGAQLRMPDGQQESLAVPRRPLETMVAHLRSGANRLPGTLIEHKALSVALHYRNAPQFEAEARRLARSALSGHEKDFVIQAGKMVFEIRPRGANKGSALRRLMSFPPFIGRRPLMAGDDVTDESAFEIANVLGGITIKIGPGLSVARWRLDTPQALADWLGSLLADQTGTDATEEVAKGNP
jgi:trehalose 6-phosphate phosphatase